MARRTENAPMLDFEARKKMFAHIELVGTDVLLCPDVPPVKIGNIFLTDKALEDAIKNSFKAGAMVLAVGPLDKFLPDDVLGKRVKLTPDSSGTIKYQEEGEHGYTAIVIPSHQIAVILNKKEEEK